MRLSKGLVVLCGALIVTMFAFSVTPAEAGLFRRRGRRVAPVQATGHVASKSWQKIAQLRANAMARRGNLTHNIHRIADCPCYPAEVAEGIGYGGSPQCATCTFRGRAVVADAHARAADGTYYRVRFWR